MLIKHRIYESTLYVVLIGELDEHSAYHTRISLDEIFETPKFKQIIIDLSELDFMDSTGIGVLIGRYKKMKDKQIPIFICNPSSCWKNIQNDRIIWNYAQNFLRRTLWN